MTKPRRYVSSYDPKAPLPGVGSIYVWELDLPHACELIKVTEVFWNGEEWWVRTERLHAPAVFGDPTSHLNELGRFWEAVTPVREVRSPRPPLCAPDPLGDGASR
jgi:hypothetical protein